MPVARNCQKTCPCQNVNKTVQNISQSQYIHLFILVKTYKGDIHKPRGQLRGVKQTTIL